MTLALIIGVLAFAVAAATIDHSHPLESRLAKMAAASGVIVLLVVVAAEWNAYALLVLSALALSWIGDLALSYAGRQPFVIGLVSFGLAHVAYTTAFVARGGLSLALTVGAGAVMVVCGAVVLSWLRPHRPDELRWPLAAYVAIIGLMVATAVGTLGKDPNPLIPVAATLFAASDLLVARQRFVSEASINRIIGLPLYFLAQVLFALSAS